MSRKEEQGVLLTLVLWVVGWGVWVVGLDSSTTGADSLFGAASQLHQFLREGRWEQLWPLLTHSDFHPPLPYLVAGLIAALLGGGVFAVRMSVVLLHAVAVLQVHRLGRTVSGDRSTAVLAALLTAVTPVIAGWFRLDHQEPLTTVMLLATLQLAVTTDLHRQRRRALLLGLLLGLGALTKLSFPAILLLPALLYLGMRVRTAPAAINAGLALLVCLAVSGWWYVGHLEGIALNWQWSTSTQSTGVGTKLQLYLVSAAGNAPLTLAALCGVALAWRQRSVDRSALTLLASTWLLGYALFILVLDYWGRYILPLLPLSALFAAVAGVAALRRVPGRRRRTVGVTAALLIAALSVLPTLLLETGDRSAGLISPDRTDHTAVLRGCRLLAARGASAVWAADTDEALHGAGARLEVAQFDARQPAVNWATLADADRRLSSGGEVYAMIVTTQPGQGRRGQIWRKDGQPMWDWVASQRKELVQRFVDGTPFVVEVYRLKGRRGAAPGQRRLEGGAALEPQNQLGDEQSSPLAQRRGEGLIAQVDGLHLGREEGLLHVVEVGRRGLGQICRGFQAQRGCVEDPQSCEFSDNG